MLLETRLAERLAIRRQFVISEDHSRDTFFPKPEEGQSLISFLSSQDFHTCAELDKVFSFMSLCI